MKISEHLSLAEVTRSDSAKRRGISNMPTPAHIENFKLLAENVFEPIRKHFGKPIHISSGYRSKALNTAVGGALSSQHCTGEAIDIDMDGTTVKNADIFNFIKDNLNFDQLIWEFGTNDNPDWVHVSYESTGKQRKQILKAVKKGGATAYVNSFISVIAKSNGTQGSNGDVGNVVTLFTVWDEVPDGGLVVGTGSTVTVTAQAPETAYLANSWGTIAVAGSATGS